MSLQMNFNLSANVGGGLSVQASPVEVGNVDIAINETFGASSTNVLVSVAFTAANVQGVILVASTNMTIKTNSSSSPAQTISLIAGVPLYWEVSGGYFSNPFTSNVTAFYITCTNAGSLKGHIVTS